MLPCSEAGKPSSLTRVPRGRSRPGRLSLASNDPFHVHACVCTDTTSSTFNYAKMQTMQMSKSFVGAPLQAVRPQQASPSRSRTQVVRAGKYDEELQQTAVSPCPLPSA